LWKKVPTDLYLYHKSAHSLNRSISNTNKENTTHNVGKSYNICIFKCIEKRSVFMAASLEITSMSTKGQVVIPNDIRNALNVSAGSKFVVMSDGKNILLKPIEKPKLEEFRDLLKQSQKIAKEAGIKKEDLSGLIKKVRDESHT
jgi:AbrB family looped-hinge helix DNA binding protein